MSRLVSETGKGSRSDTRGRKADDPIHVTSLDPGIQRGGVYFVFSFRIVRAAALHRSRRAKREDAEI
jgi:hypothetical protein